MADCLFCKIAKKEVPAKIAHEEGEVIAFWDIKPEAPVHIIIIPREHIERISDIDEKNASLVGKLFLTAKELAKKHKIDASGYRLVINCNKDAGQAVFHLHLHLLGGRKFSWPPG